MFEWVFLGEIHLNFCTVRKSWFCPSSVAVLETREESAHSLRGGKRHVTEGQGGKAPSSGDEPDCTCHRLSMYVNFLFRLF